MTVPTSPRGRHNRVLAAAMIAIAGAVALIVAAFAVPGRPQAGGLAAGRFLRLAAAPAPAGWPNLTLPSGKALLAYPPSLHRVAGDTDAVSVAQLDSHGMYRAYLNATPRQGSESLRNWANFRLRLLRADDAVSARLVAAAPGVRFRGGTGSCVMDTYVTRIGHHSYQEIACLVQGRTSASVVVAATPASRWTQESPALLKAVAAYQVR